MSGPDKIISDEEIIHVHACANFGSMTPRDVVNDGVRKYAVGFTGGSTQVAILREHGLITAPRGAGYRANLTEKGKRYARAIYSTRTPDPAQIRADALREAIWAAFIAGVSQGSDEATAYEWGTTPQQSRQQAFDDFMADWNEDSAYLRSLIDAPLSPPAVDTSPAPDAGGDVAQAMHRAEFYGAGE